MRDVPECELLERFSRDGSEEAFTELVRRHVGIVYSVALRHTDDLQHAQDITQAVFVILARKASSLGSKTVLSGWLYSAARLTAANFRRAEFRRVRREQEVYMQSISEETPPEVAWSELAPLLDEAMARLGAADRDAVVLRYFENKSLEEVGVAMGLETRAAQKRVTRALEKLRRIFSQRGVVLTTAILASAVSANSVQAAPASMAAAVAGAAVGGAASGGTLTLIKGVLKLMAWTKAKMAIGIGVAAILAAGTGTIVLNSIPPKVKESYFQSDFPALRKVPRNISVIRETHYDNGTGSSHWLFDPSDGRAVGRNESIDTLLDEAYEAYCRNVLPRDFPQGRFDYLITGQSDIRKAMREKLKKMFGLVAHKEIRQTDVLLLQVKTTNAPGLILSIGGISRRNPENGSYSSTNETISSLANFMESVLQIPVLDRTGLTNHFDYKLTYDGLGTDGMKAAILNQLGLEFVPSREPLEMLVVERVKP